MGYDTEPGGMAPEGKAARILPEHARSAGDLEPNSPAADLGASGEDAGTRPVETGGPPPPAPHPGRSTGVVIVVGILAVLVLSCMLLAFATVQSGIQGIGRLAGGIPGFNISLLATPTVTINTSQPAVVDRIRAIGRLESVNYQVEKVVSGSSTGPLPAFLTGDKILLVAHGEVVGGVDLEKLTPNDVTTTGKIAILRLPPAEILSSKLDNDKTYVYDRQTGIFSKPNPQLESQVRAAAEQQIVQAAKEDGILSQGTHNAQRTLTALLKGLGFDEVKFEEEP